jgi:hypothetical protein
MREKIMQLPMSYIKDAYVRWNNTNEITQEWCSTLPNFVSALRKYYQNDSTVVLYSDVHEFWHNPNLDINLR